MHDERFPGLRRRGFLAATSGAAALALVGCSGGTDDKAAGASGTPKRGGRLRAAFAGGGASETLDPHLGNLFADVARSKALFDKLADYGADLSARPRLAEKWESNKTLDRWQVTLREATFHDGSPVTAKDVLYSYRRIADPKQAFRAKASLEPIDLDASRATGTRSIEFVLKRPTAEFPNVLAAFGAYIVPENATEFDDKPIGSGPFRFVSFAPGRSAVFRRNDAYWDGAPLLDEIEFVVANEESARVNALLGGQVEYAHELNPTTARAHESGGQIEIVRLRNSAMQAFCMKTDRAPFDDKRVREAFFLIADRRELVDGALSGAGEIGNDLFGKGYEYYAADLPQRTQDLDRARSCSSRPAPRSSRSAWTRRPSPRGSPRRPASSATRPRRRASRSTSGWAARTRTGATSSTAAPCAATAPAPCPSSPTSPSGCSPTPPPTPPSGSTRISTASISRPSPSATRLSVRPCTSVCSAVCTPRAAFSSGASPTGSSEPPAR